MRLFSSNEEEIVEMPASEETFEDENDASSNSLLAQIDEFRKKAEALQNLINDRQEKYNELSATLKESEDRYALLQSEVSLKDESMNGIIDAVSEKLNIFADRIDTSVSNTVTENISSLSDTMTENVSSVSDSVSDAIKGNNEPVIDKIHTENVRLYRNLYDFVKEDYSMEKIEKLVETSVKKNRGPIGFCLVLTVVNTAILVCLILLQLGIISF